MQAYIKRMKDFTTIGHLEAVEWTLPLGSNDGSTGAVKAIGSNLLDYVGEWLILDGRLFVIEGAKPEDDNTTLTVGDTISAFYRSHGIGSQSTASAGAFLTDTFTVNYKNQSDTEYAMPYLAVTNTDTSAYITPELSDGLFVFADYIRMCIKRGVAVVFSFTNTALNISISTASTTPKNIVIGDGHSQLITEDYSADTTSKVTVIKAGTYYTYYLQADGTAGTTAPSPRIKGKWVMLPVGDDEDTLQAAQGVFYDNSYSNKVCFHSDRCLNYGDLIRVKIGETVHTLQISSATLNSDDTRYQYSAGDLPTTLVDKVKALGSAVSSGSGGSAAGAVLYTQQSLTAEQQSQARVNIGVNGSGAVLDGAVRYDGLQSLNDTQKGNAKTNIGLTDAYINGLIDAKLGVIENGYY